MAKGHASDEDLWAPGAAMRPAEAPPSGGWLSRGIGCGGAVGALGLGFVILLVAIAAGSGLKGCDVDFGGNKGTNSEHVAIRASRTTGLRGGEVVTVTSRAFRADEIVGVTLCLREADTDRRGVDACDTVTGSRFAASADGHLRATYRIPRLITVGGVPYDCASEPRRCLIVAAAASDFDRSGGRSLTFRADLPKAPLVGRTKRAQTDRLPIVATPASPHRDGAPVRLVARGFQPGEPVLLAWCTDEFERLGPIDACEAEDISDAFTALAARSTANIAHRASADGTVTVTLPAKAMVLPAGSPDGALGQVGETTTSGPSTSGPTTTTRPSAPKGQIDCRTASGRCQFVIAAAADTKRSALLPYAVAPG